MSVDRWSEADSATPCLIRHYELGDPEPSGDTVVRCPDGQERQRYGDLVWCPDAYDWSQLLTMWSGAITEEIRYSRPARALGAVLRARPGYVYDGGPGLWRWSGADWLPLQAGDRVVAEDGRPGLWDGRLVRPHELHQPLPVEITDEAWAAASRIAAPLPEATDLATRDSGDLDSRDLVTTYARRCVEAAAVVVHDLCRGRHPTIALPSDWKAQLDAVVDGGHSGVSLVVSWLLAASRTPPSTAGVGRVGVRGGS